MTNRRIVTHLAFAMIGAALVAEALAASALAAASDRLSLWNGAPLHEIQFTVVSTYHTAADYGAQLLDALSQFIG